MLTNKDIIEALTSVGYTLKEISSLTKLSNKTLNKMKKNEEVSENDEKIMNNFFRMNMTEVEISKFSDEDFRKTNLIMTPNGFKEVSEYTDLGKQECLTISFGDITTIVTNGHKIQLENGVFTIAEKLKVGDKVKMFDGVVTITNITKSENNCCSISVNDNEYYVDGTVSM